MYPILFEFGAVTMFSLWLFIAIGFVVGSLIFVDLAKRSRVRLNVLAEHSMALFLWTLLVSRFTFIAFHPDLYFYHFDFSKLTEVFALWDKGLSFWGAVFAWVVGLWYFGHRKDESIIRFTDLMTPALLIGMAFGNLGAFLDGINYGIPTDLPWGITFRSAHVKYIAAIHPTQLYSMIYTLATGLVLLNLIKHLRGRFPGFVTELGILLFSMFKFFEEFLRGDEAIKLLGMRLPQLIALVIGLASIYLLYGRITNKRGNDPELIVQTHLKRFLKKKSTTQDSAETQAGSTELQNQAG